MYIPRGITENSIARENHSQSFRLKHRFYSPQIYFYLIFLLGVCVPVWCECYRIPQWHFQFVVLCATVGNQWRYYQHYHSSTNSILWRIPFVMTTLPCIAVHWLYAKENQSFIIFRRKVVSFIGNYATDFDSMNKDIFFYGRFTK